MFILLPLPGFLASIEAAQLVIAGATFVSTSIAGFVSAYVGVKVAQAEMRAELKAQGGRLATTEQNVRRLEDHWLFKSTKA